MSVTFSLLFLVCWSASVTRALSPIRVLLVDDHTILRQGLAELLADEPDIEVVGEAGDGREAVEMARQLHPAVVTMDLTMPVMSGLEATQVIVEESPTVRVIGLSMHESEEMADRMRDAGAVAYLPKGSPLTDLTGAIRGTDGT